MNAEKNKKSWQELGDEAFSSKGSLEGEFVCQPKRKSYSVIAMNLETEDDVEKVIHQCELIRQEITGGLQKLKLGSFLEEPSL